MDEQGMEMMRFDLPKDHTSIIKVIGVGGGGSNAVNYMYQQGIKGVDFIVCNTDNQALDKSDVPLKVQLGATLTEGRGAGSIPEVGKNAAVETLEEVKNLLGQTTTMVFVTAGMGGGTGTGAAPIIARAAREMGILTVGIVTIPFMFEGKKRMVQAESGLTEMRDAVDTLLVIRNDKLRELFGNLTLKQAFGHADEVLCTAAKGIAEVITLTGEINVDMNDVNTVMRDSGVAIMGSGRANGEGRALAAVTEALESPLLNDNDIEGANFILLNITYGQEEVLMDEIMEVTDHIQEQAGMSAEVIWGYGPDESLGEDICVTVIATGFMANKVDAGLPKEIEKPKKYELVSDDLKEITQKVQKPTQITPTEGPAIFEEEALEEPFIVKKDDQPLISPEEVEAEAETEAFDKMNFAPQPVAETPVENTPVEEEMPEAEAETLLNLENEIESGMIAEAMEVDETPQPELGSDLFEEERIEPEMPAEPELSFNLNEEPEQAEETQEEEKPVQMYDLMEDTLENTPPPASDSLKITENQPTEVVSDRPSREELIKKNKDRESKVKELTLRLKTPSGLADLESEPAYKRRNVELDNVPHSSESNTSRYTLTEEVDEEGNKKVKLKDNNSFLHDNVD